VKIYLYSTLGCHLCEQAKVVLWPLLLKYQFRLAEIDISTSDEMIESYGTRIPVLSAGDELSELNWPFDAEQVDGYFAELTGE
jgi:glutaredoxin